jgi:leader peptidase (prepilin peptidase)/N-methyltransferase
VDVEVSVDGLVAGDEHFELQAAGTIQATADKLTLPREAMGLGDVKLIAAIGAFLGWQATLFTIFVSSTIGGLVGLLLITIGRADLHSKIPYGPYIAFGALIWLFFGARIVQWYLSSVIL